MPLVCHKQCRSSGLSMLAPSAQNAHFNATAPNAAESRSVEEISREFPSRSSSSPPGDTPARTFTRQCSPMRFSTLAAARHRRSFTWRALFCLRHFARIPAGVAHQRQRPVGARPPADRHHWRRRLHDPPVIWPPDEPDRAHHLSLIHSRSWHIRPLRGPAARFSDNPAGRGPKS